MIWKFHFKRFLWLRESLENMHMYVYIWLFIGALFITLKA